MDESKTRNTSLKAKQPQGCAQLCKDFNYHAGEWFKGHGNKDARLAKKQSHKAFPENGFLSNSAKENHAQPWAASINLGPPQSRARGKARTARAGGARIPFKITKPKRGLCGGALEKVGGQMIRPKWNP